jgi:hypothetical protein
MPRDADDRALFALLGVDDRASWEDVRRAFRTAVRSSHPDLHAGDPEAEQRLKTLNAAWESINTPSKWAAYILAPASAAAPGGAARTPGRSASAATVTRLRVHRQRRGSAGLANWQLELDGTVVASIENGGVTLLEAEPGGHSLRVFYGSRSSPSLRVVLQRGQELVLGCRQLESLRAGLFSPKRSLVLEVLSRERLDSA